MSALDGTFEVGDLVWVQMYDPSLPSWDATIERRLAEGHLYGQRRVMRLAGITENFNTTGYAQEMGRDLPTVYATRWWLVDVERPRDESLMSWVDSTWATIEHAAVESALW